jgi:hypothetical protein
MMTMMNTTKFLLVLSFAAHAAAHAAAASRRKRRRTSFRIVHQGHIHHVFTDDNARE